MTPLRPELMATVTGGAGNCCASCVRQTPPKLTAGHGRNRGRDRLRSRSVPQLPARINRFLHSANIILKNKGKKKISRPNQPSPRQASKLASEPIYRAMDVNDVIEHEQPHTHTHTHTHTNTHTGRRFQSRRGHGVRILGRRLQSRHGRRLRHSFVADARNTKPDERDRGHSEDLFGWVPF